MLIPILAVWSGTVLTDMSFVHPGAIDTSANLDFVKARITAGEQPWTRKFNKISNSPAVTLGNSRITLISNHQDADVARDNGHHSQYALGSALHVAEVAWNLVYETPTHAGLPGETGSE